MAEYRCTVCNYVYDELKPIDTSMADAGIDKETK